MLTELKNFVFHFPLSSLLFIGKWQGLMVFAYETDPIITYTISNFFHVYSCVYTVFIVISLQTLAAKYLSWFPYFLQVSKVIMVFVYVTELLITLYRVMMVYILQFYYRNHFRNLLPEAMHLHRGVRVLMNGALTFNKSFYRCYISKIAGVLFQLVIISYLVSLYKQMASAIFDSDLATFSMFIYIHITAITMSSIFYVGMMFILLIFQNLNQKLCQLSDSIKDIELKLRFKCELCGRLSDDIDQIVCIYERTLTFLKNFNKLFSVQLFFTFVNAIYVALVEVVQVLLDTLS